MLQERELDTMGKTTIFAIVVIVAADVLAIIGLPFSELIGLALVTLRFTDKFVPAIFAVSSLVQHIEECKKRKLFKFRQSSASRGFARANQGMFEVSCIIENLV